MKLHFYLKVVPVAVIIAAASFANAGVMGFTGVGLGEYPVVISGTFNETVFAGLLNFSTSDMGNITTVCADLGHLISTSTTPWIYTIYHTAPMIGGLHAAGNIVAAHFADATTNEKAAGLELAVWEATYDNGAAFDPTTGNTQFNASAGALAWASTFYTARTIESDALYLTPSPGEYGQAQMKPVPEPASIVVMISGAAGLLLRRRKA